jgi:N-methylhydantoinase A
MHRVAVDIGGTFTDLVSIDEGDDKIRIAKDSTTPGNFALGVLNTLSKSGLNPSEIQRFVHGSTVIINALLERKGAPTALLTTKGFRDVLEIGRANRPDMYNSLYEKPKPFVARHHRFEVDERLDHEGRILRRLNPHDVRKAAQACRQDDITTLAVCYLHSYANPEHETQTRDIIRETHPEATVTLSHELTREWREFERSSTAVLNAYVRPTAERYLTTLDRDLNRMGLAGIKHAMQSNGGVTTFGNAMERPIQLVESGPVGGVIGASLLGQAIGEPNIISMDVGGTTVKTSLIENGVVRVNTDYKLEANAFQPGYPIKVPVVDIVEIGAGGGSLARIDSEGSLQVGPESAGAVPGPACYGKGGEEPTLTDANVVAGRINPDYFLGGEIKLDPGRAAQAIERLASRLELGLRETALGVIRLANSNMINALRMVSVRRGHDPRDFILVAMGGGGGLHAAPLAEELGVRKVVVPRTPAHFSAWGMLMTDLRHDYVITRVAPWTATSLAGINAAFEDLEASAAKQFSDEDVAADRIVMSRSVNMRYVGQDHTIGVPVPATRIDEAECRATEERFHSLHEFRYKFRLEDPVEAVDFHVVAIGRLRRHALRPLESRRPDGEVPIKGSRDVDFDQDGVLSTRIFERDSLPPFVQVAGPAVIEESAATTLVYPRQVLLVDAYGNLIISPGGGH